MYVCGITPYDASHLGHASTYVAFDLVHRLWLDRGHTVRYVQNVTDIDDPLFARAERDGVAWTELASTQTDRFRRDMADLRVLPPSDLVGVRESVDEIAERITELLAHGAAYRLDDDVDGPDVYFDVAAAARFGYVSGFAPSTMIELSAERGGDPAREGKKHPLDPLLWRGARGDTAQWRSVLGPGRPGWHIGCATIALNRLGSPIDLQGGGHDLVFPHHECTAAQAEVLTGRRPFARHYVHSGLLQRGGTPMSKSRGNLVSPRDLVDDGVHPMIVRLALLSRHYRTPGSWHADRLDHARRRLVLWGDAFRSPEGPDASGLTRTLRERLADDLDTPGALAAVDAWAEATLTQRHPRADAGLEVARAVDALLGIVVPVERPRGTVTASPAAPPLFPTGPPDPDEGATDAHRTQRHHDEHPGDDR